MAALAEVDFFDASGVIKTDGADAIHYSAAT